MRRVDLRLLLLMEALLETFWKPILIALLAALAWIGWKTEEGRITKLNVTVAAQARQHEQDARDIEVQNAAVLKLQVEGQEQQATINGLAAEAQINAGKVEVQWKTKYVPQSVPVECAAAVAAGAENAASVARLFQTSP